MFVFIFVISYEVRMESNITIFRRDVELLSASEVYIGLGGEGLILMQNRKGEVRHLRIAHNSCVFIPPGFAHRTINTGAQPLIFLAVYPANAGHDYESIAERGFHKIVVDRNGEPVIMDNPRRKRG